MYERFATALVLTVLAAYPSAGAAAPLQRDSEAVAASETLRVKDAKVDIEVGGAPLRLQASLVVMGAAAGKPSEAYFVRVDRSTMTQAGLGENFAALVRAFPSSCSQAKCELELTLDPASGAYALTGDPATYDVRAGDSEYKYVSIRRLA